jgi:hypothetical protein
MLALDFRQQQKKQTMKQSKACIFLLLPALFLSGCYKEEALIPTQLSSAGEKFIFPQGASPADVLFEKIDEEYNVKIIYKAFTQNDVNRSWLSPSGQDLIKTEWKWTYVTDEQIESAATTLQRKVFSLLPVSVVKAGMRPYPYMYLIDGIYPVSSGLHVPLYPSKALDGIAVNLELSAMPDNYTHKVFFPLRIAAEIFTLAYAQGAISMPDAFFDGIEQENDNISCNSANDPAQGGGPGTERYERYWARRGHIPFIGLEGQISVDKNTRHNSSSAIAIAPLNQKDSEAVYFFMFLSLDRHWRNYFESGNLFYDCPLLENRITMFYNRMKDVYGINFDDIQEKLYAETDIDTSPDRLYDRERDKDKNYQTYIYTSD